MRLKKFRIRPLAGLIILQVFILSFFENRSFAGMVASQLSENVRERDIAVLKRFLDTRIVEERLLEWGYEKEEIINRLNNLSDEELHYFASRADSLQRGGDAVGAVLGFILALLLIALLLILILELTGHDVVITPKSRK